MDDAFVDAIVRDHGQGNWRDAIRYLLRYVGQLQARLLRIQKGEEDPLGRKPRTDLDRELSSVEHMVVCTECSHCLHRTAQPPAMVKAFYKDRDVTLRDWAASQRCRCGQLGVDVVLRDPREAKNWMLQR